MAGISRGNGNTRVRPVVWITGASTGIGAALAREMARQGYVVAASARKISELKTLESDAARLKGAIRAYPCDVEDRLGMQLTHDNIVRELGPISIAIFNAGVYLPLDGRKIDSALFRKSFDVNVMGVVHGLEAVIPPMVACQCGRIVIVSSVTGYGGLPTSSAYGATKAALINMAESLKFDLDKAKVGIQVVNPGFVKTPATDSNEFKMPFIVTAEKAARRIMRGIRKGHFEITFPRRFTFMLKFLQLLPYRAYFALTRKMTGANKDA